MDVNDVKALIKSLVLTATSAYSVPKLVRDFEDETGIRFPLYNFSNPKAFLKSLTDTIKFVGESPYEKILPVVSEKTEHISSLIRRQGRMGFQQRILPHPDTYLSEIPFQEENSTLPKKSSNIEKSRSVVVNDGNKDESKGLTSGKDLCDNIYEDYIFKEDEINSIQKHTGIDPGLSLISPVKSKNFDLVSDSGSLTSSYKSSGSCFVNEGVKNKLKELMKKQTGGMWCCDLPGLFEDIYKYPLEFKEFGYRSLIDMVMELNDIFRCVRPGNGDWLLFDASRPPSQEESDIRSTSQCKIPEYVEKNLLELIESHCENGTKPGVYLDDLLVLYFKKFRKRLNFTEFGFPNIKSLLTKLDGHVLRLRKEGYRFIIKPLLEHNMVKQETAVLPITPDDDFFTELFPNDVVKQGESFPKIKIENHFRVGEKVDVNVADVWSPNKFFVQLKAYEEEFFSLNKDLQAFYNRNRNKYKMPDSTIQQNQVCVAYFKDGDEFDEWNRSVIVRITKPNEALVHFVDYGNRARIDKKYLRFLHRDYFNLPAQSFAAKLSFIEPPSDNVWPTETCEKFLKLVSVPTAEFYVTSVDPKEAKISGIIIAVNGNNRVNVGRALVKEKMAVCNDISQLEHYGQPRTNLIDEKSIYKNDLPSDSFVNASKIDRNEESSEEINRGQCEIFQLNDIADKKIHNQDSSKRIEESLATSSKFSNKNICVASRPPFQVEKDVYALAFWVISTNQLVRKMAQADLDIGLQMALNLARNIVECEQNQLRRLDIIF